MTILDAMKVKYHDVEGINDARNITEAVARIQGVTGPAAGGAIADYISPTPKPSTPSGSNIRVEHPC